MHLGGAVARPLRMIGAMTPAMIAARGVAASAAPARATASARAPGITPGAADLASRAAVAPRRVARRLAAPSARRPLLRAASRPISADSKIRLSNEDPPRPFFDSKEANEIAGYANFSSREQLREAALVDRHNVPNTPLSKPYQQTLRRSFTLCGIGLHSGVVETVRVCPARADEGRYFVRVPAGTIPDAADDDAEGGAFSRRGLTDEETEDMLLEQLRSMMSNKDESKDGSAQRARELASKSASAAESPDSFGSKDEVRIAASLALVQDDLRLSTRLGADGEGVGTVEHLLSALEAIGVDNARVEVEGSGEIPILDGSAYEFCYHAARVGLVPATKEGAEGAEVPRMAWKLTEPITVNEGDAFITLNPDAVTKLTYGIDFTYKSRAIGKQWESWTPTEDGNYTDVLARARTFGTMSDIMAYFRAGYIRGGTEHCALIANGDQFWNPPMLLPHEPARHKLLDLIGDLSLLAEPGMAGVPVGHVVAYKAGHNLHAKFAKAVAAAAAAGKATKVPAEMWSRELGLEANDAEVRSMARIMPMDTREYPTG